MKRNINIQYDLDKLRMERARKGMSISELADQSKLNAKTVMRIENKKVIPKYRQLER